MREKTTRRRGWVALLVLAVLASLGLVGCGNGKAEVTIGLILKQEVNPYWTTMRSVAERTASQDNVKLIVAAGSSDVDVASQLAAISDMVDQQVDGIIITPNSSTELSGALRAAKDAGIIVIAADTPVIPSDAVNAYYATDNTQAGQLVGEYAKARATELGITPQIAMLNLAPGIASGTDRTAGFLTGFGITASDPQLVASVDSQGDQQLGHDLMAQVISEHPGVNVVYTVNERAVLGALSAIEEAGLDRSKMVIVSVDGGCVTMRDAVRPGLIDATAMQFPENMAREGVRTIADAVRGDGQTPSGYLNTGVELVSGHPVPGVASRNVEYGIRNCWG